MGHSSVLFIELEFGRKLIIQADTPKGPINMRGEVVYVGSHHFRVKCDTPFPTGYLDPDHEVRLVLASQPGMLPVTTNFIRIVDKKPRIVILSLPSGSWQRNRRAFFRGEVEVSVILIKNDGTRVHGKTMNLSGGGALIQVEEQLKVNEEIDMEISFSDQEKASARVKVIRIDHANDCDELGVKFIEISDRDQNHICKIVLVSEFENRRAEIRELTGRT